MGKANAIIRKSTAMDGCVMIDFNSIGKYKENNRIEAKRATGGLPRSIWETYSAFANTIGGVLLLGVIEMPDKSFRLVDLPHARRMVREFWTILNDPKKVSANILTKDDVEIREIDGKRIIVISVPKAQRRDKPVYIGESPYTGSYRRNGEGDYHCTRQETDNMLRDREELSFDMRLLSELGLEVLDFDSVKRYRRRMKESRPGHIWENLSDRDFLIRLDALGRGADKELHPTRAGLLMFGYEYEIIKSFPGFFLDYQEYEDGAGECSRRIVSSFGDFSGNLFDFYFRVKDRLLELHPEKDIQQALGEALANSMLHADYADNEGVWIQKNPEKIEFSNPGRLRVSVPQAVTGGKSDAANRALIKLFRLLGIGTQTGSGIPAIFAAWEKLGLKKPVLKEHFNPDRISFILSFEKQTEAWQEKQESKVWRIREEGREAVISLITSRIEVSLSELCRELNMKPAGARRIIKSLLEEELLMEEGEGAQRHYRLKS